MRAILSVAGLRTFVNHLPNCCDRTTFLVRVTFVVDYIDDQVHFPGRNAKGWEEVETKLFVDSDGNVGNLSSIFLLRRANGGEEKMGPVFLPVQPLELSDFWDPRADIDSRVQIVIRGDIFGEQEPSTLDCSKRLLYDV